MRKEVQRPLQRRYGRIFGPARLVAHFGKVLGGHHQSLIIVITLCKMLITQISSHTKVLAEGCGLARVPVHRHWKVTGRLKFLLVAFLPYVPSPSI